MSPAHPSTPPAPPGFAPALVDALLEAMCASGGRVQGISGLQGTGKSTLAAQLVDAAQARGLRAVALSLDDFYLDLPARQALARQVHPLMATRGPPGSHDLPLALATLDALRAGTTVAVPRFDKLGDRRLPAVLWPRVDACDLVLFEGWCLGATAQPEAALAEPVNALERDDDADGRWRRYCNQALGRDYPALWARIDRMLFLQPPSFDVVPRWRWQQQQALEAARGVQHAGTPVQDRAAIDAFVAHFERVSRHVLATLPAQADQVLVLDAQRRPLSPAVAPGGSGGAATPPAG